MKLLDKWRLSIGILKYCVFINKNGHTKECIVRKFNTIGDG